MTKKEHTTITELFQVLDLLESLDMQFWLDGGWGVDVLYGQQTRLHRDIDIDFDANYTDQLLDLLQERGYQIETNWLPTRVELYSKELGYIDIHPFVLNADGTSKQADLDGGWYEFNRTILEQQSLKAEASLAFLQKGNKYSIRATI